MMIYDDAKRAEMARETAAQMLSEHTAKKHDGCHFCEKILSALIARAQRDAIEAAELVARRMQDGSDEGSDWDLACTRIADGIRALLKDTP